jgi:hypothetical protein
VMVRRGGGYMNLMDFLDDWVLHHQSWAAWVKQKTEGSASLSGYIFRFRRFSLHMLCHPVLTDDCLGVLILFRNLQSVASTPCGIRLSCIWCIILRHVAKCDLNYAETSCCPIIFGQYVTWYHLSRLVAELFLKICAHVILVGKKRV